MLPALWQLLNIIKGGGAGVTTMGGSGGGSGANILNVAVSKLVKSLYEQMGEQLVDKAANSSSVPARNLELLKELIANPID